MIKGSQRGGEREGRGQGQVGKMGRCRGRKRTKERPEVGVKKKKVGSERRVNMLLKNIWLF